MVLGKAEIRLTPKEFELLVFMARHPNRVLPHRTNVMAIWGEHAIESARAALGARDQTAQEDRAVPSTRVIS